MRLKINVFKTFNRSYSVKRKYPIDPNHINEVPISKYALPSFKNRVYVWGNARTGALGTPQLKKKENSQFIEYLQCPKRLHFAEKNEVTNLAVGFGFTIFAVNSPETKLFGAGLNTDSQIGYHEVRADKPLSVIFLPQPIFLPIDKDSKVLKVSAGRAHAAALTQEGLFMLGNNSYGQCGREIVNDEDYTRNKTLQCISNVDGFKIIDVECGQDHTLILLENGSVYSCGWGADGQTGLGHYNIEYKFSKVNGDIANEKIVKLACRSDFVMALNDKGEVFGWGNTEYNQITLADNSQQISNPAAIKMLEKLGPIKDIASGGSFCSILNMNGNVFVWGFGLLGTGPEVQESKTPIAIPQQLFGLNDFNPDCVVESISCGLSHFGAVTNKGDLYTWDKGEVFGWGNTEYNQITLADNSQQISNPAAIKMLEKLGPIKDIASGGSFCSILNMNGNVFVWGFGLLGTGPEVQESKTPIAIPQQLFGLNDFNPDCVVESISCGLSHFGAVTNKGDLYTWGRNRSSCLGLGHKKDQYFPLKVALGASVKRVFCGLDHTVALCESYLTEKQ